MVSSGLFRQIIIPKSAFILKILSKRRYKRFFVPNLDWNWIWFGIGIVKYRLETKFTSSPKSKEDLSIRVLNLINWNRTRWGMLPVETEGNYSQFTIQLVNSLLLWLPAWKATTTKCINKWYWSLNFKRDSYGGTEFIICNLFLQKLFIKK